MDLDESLIDSPVSLVRNHLNYPTKEAPDPIRAPKALFLFDEQKLLFIHIYNFFAVCGGSPVHHLHRVLCVAQGQPLVAYCGEEKIFLLCCFLYPVISPFNTDNDLWNKCVCGGQDLLLSGILLDYATMFDPILMLDVISVDQIRPDNVRRDAGFDLVRPLLGRNVVHGHKSAAIGTEGGGTSTKFRRQREGAIT